MPPSVRSVLSDVLSAPETGNTSGDVMPYQFLQPRYFVLGVSWLVLTHQLPSFIARLDGLADDYKVIENSHGCFFSATCFGCNLL